MNTTTQPGPGYGIMITPATSTKPPTMPISALKTGRGSLLLSFSN